MFVLSELNILLDTSYVTNIFDSNCDSYEWGFKAFLRITSSLPPHLTDINWQLNTSNDYWATVQIRSYTIKSILIKINVIESKCFILLFYVFCPIRDIAKISGGIQCVLPHWLVFNDTKL